MRKSRDKVSIHRYSKEGIPIIPVVQGDASEPKWILFLENQREIITSARAGQVNSKGKGNTPRVKGILRSPSGFRGTGIARRIMRPCKSWNPYEACRGRSQTEEKIQGNDRQ